MPISSQALSTKTLVVRYREGSETIRVGGVGAKWHQSTGGLHKPNGYFVDCDIVRSPAKAEGSEV